jgi:hypothetical protein
MRRYMLLVAMAISAVAGCKSKRPAPTHDEKLRAGLLQHLKTDQAVRQEMIDRLQSGAKLDSALAAHFSAVDTVNTAWLKSVVATHGWPGTSVVGDDGEDAAFLLVQHADRDTAFQATVLPLLERAYAEREATGQQVAMLTDRVAKARGQPQVYGTQADMRDGRVDLYPIADSPHVDARRTHVGMIPLSEYLRMLDSMYTAQPKR